MSRRFAPRALVLFLLATQYAPAGEKWNCLRSDHFDLFTQEDAKTGSEALVFFERVRRIFTETLGLKLPENQRVTVIAFRDERSFAPYKPQESVAAYSITQTFHNFIVMQDLTPEHYSVALHEYTHVVCNQAGLKLPLWLNEGFAEVYATLKPRGNKILVGRIIPERLALAQAGLIDLRQVLGADRSSLMYHKNEQVGTFYAESWALVHMLKFSDAYSPKFDRVLDAIGQGKPSSFALESVYHKTVEQIQRDLALYVKSSKFREGVISSKLDKPVTPAKQVPVDPMDVEIGLAVIEARGPHRQDGIGKLQELANANPRNPAPSASLAWVELSGNDPRAAETPFRRALEAGTKDANLCYQFAVRLREEIPEGEYLAALRRAVEIDPEMSAAQRQLAVHAFNSRDYKEAVTRLHLIRKLDRASAFEYYRALSFAAFQIGNETEAKSAADRAKEYASTPEQKLKTDELMNYLTRANPSMDTPRLSENP